MDNWPARRTTNFVAIMEKEGHIVKPGYLRRWSRDSALDAMAAYLGVDRPTFEKIHPIDFMTRVNRYGYCPFVGLGVAWPSLDSLLPRDVICAYRGPAICTEWLWSGPTMLNVNMDTTFRVNQKRLLDAERLWDRPDSDD